MRGFTDKALILLSDPDYYEEATPTFQLRYKTAVANIIDYLQSIGVQHYCLISDTLATRINMHKPVWLATGDPGDMFFMQNFCSVPSYKTQPLSEELASKVRKKFPIERGSSPADRFNVVAKRVRFVEKALCSDFNFIVVFGKTYNPVTKPGDGRAVMYVDSRHLNASMYLSGEPVSINDFMQLSYANISLSEWGKYNVTILSDNA